MLEDCVCKTQKTIISNIVPDKLYELEPLKACIARRMSHIYEFYHLCRWEEFWMETSVDPFVIMGLVSSTCTEPDSAVSRDENTEYDDAGDYVFFHTR